MPIGDPNSISLETYHAMLARDMSEQKLQDAIIGIAVKTGWLVYHTHDSRRSQAGYPDLHLVHAGRGLSVLRELKSEKGVVSPDQKKWLAALTAAGVDAAVWRPSDWFNKTIEALIYPEAR